MLLQGCQGHRCKPIDSTVHYSGNPTSRELPQSNGKGGGKTASSQGPASTRETDQAGLSGLWYHCRAALPQGYLQMSCSKFFPMFFWVFAQVLSPILASHTQPLPLATCDPFKTRGALNVGSIDQVASEWSLDIGADLKSFHSSPLQKPVTRPITGPLECFSWAPTFSSDQGYSPLCFLSSTCFSRE